MNILAAANISASALDAQKLRLDIVSENIANAHTTKGVDGQPYQRKVVSFESVLDATSGGQGVRVSDVSTDDSKGEMVHNPQHPHADSKGMVQMPNVNIATEMIDMVTATRAYEANLAVVRNARQMATQALSIGR